MSRLSHAMPRRVVAIMDLPCRCGLAEARSRALAGHPDLLRGLPLPRTIVTGGSATGLRGAAAVLGSFLEPAGKAAGGSR